MKQLLATFDARELMEWQAFFALEPFGPWADNLNVGRLLAQIRGLFKKKGSTPDKPQDLSLGDYSKPLWQTAQSTETMLIKAEDIANAFGAIRKTRDKK